jgi:hypothetical protein
MEFKRAENRSAAAEVFGKLLAVWACIPAIVGGLFLWVWDSVFVWTFHAPELTYWQSVKLVFLVAALARMVIHLGRGVFQDD